MYHVLHNSTYSDTCEDTWTAVNQRNDCRYFARGEKPVLTRKKSRPRRSTIDIHIIASYDVFTVKKLSGKFKYPSVLPYFFLYYYTWKNTKIKWNFTLSFLCKVEQQYCMRKFFQECWSSQGIIIRSIPFSNLVFRLPFLLAAIHTTTICDHFHSFGPGVLIYPSALFRLLLIFTNICLDVSTFIRTNEINFK